MEITGAEELKKRIRCSQCEDTFLIVDDKEVPDLKRFYACPKCDALGAAKDNEKKKELS